MAEEESAEHYLQILFAKGREIWDQWKRMTGVIRDNWGRRQGTRAVVEEGLRRRSWDKDQYDATQDQDPRDRTRDYERTAADVRAAEELAAGNRGLEQQRQALQAEVDDAQQRLDRQDAELNDDRDRDGIPDDIENRTDLDRDHRDDATERRDEIDQQNEDANDRDGDGVDDAVEDREAQQARDDEARRKQEEDRRRDQQREEGVGAVDAVDAVPAAVGAAEAANALDDERADDLQQQDVGADGELHDPSTEAANQQQAETDVAEQDQVNPGANEQAGLDAVNTQDDLSQNGQLLDEDGVLRDSTIGAEGQQQNPALDQTGEFVDQDGAVRSQTLGAEGQQQDSGLDQGGEFVDQDGVLRDGTIGADNAQQAGIDQSVGQDGPAVTSVRDGSHLELDSDQEWDGTVYQTGEEGASLTVHGSEQGQQQTGAEVAGPEQDGTQSGEAVNVGSIEGQTFTVDQGNIQFANENGAESGQQDGLDQDQHVSGPAQEPQSVQAQPAQSQQVDAQQVDTQQVEAPEQGQQQMPEQGQQQMSEQGMGEQSPNQAGQQLNAQQVGNAAQSGVDQSAALGSDQQGQSQGGQESQAQSQWRPPAEEPLLDQQRATNGPNQPGSQIPPGERDTLTRTQQGHAPAAGATSREGGGVATSERPGTPAQQRGQDRSRTDRARDDTGRER
jgi:hypothetical protein